MAGKRSGTASGKAVDALLSQRLLVVLTREMDGLEAASKEIMPRGEDGDTSSAGAVSAGAKARIEAVGQMTRTLEKLLELKRLEVLAARGGDEDEDGEAARLRDEVLKRLRALDARRRGEPTLFDAEGRYAGDVAGGDVEAGGAVDLGGAVAKAVAGS